MLGCEQILFLSSVREYCMMQHTSFAGIHISFSDRNSLASSEQNKSSSCHISQFFQHAHIYCIGCQMLLRCVSLEYELFNLLQSDKFLMSIQTIVHLSEAYDNLLTIG